MANIRVLIVDDLPETRENVRKLLQFESDIEVIGQAGTGEEAVEMAQEYQPDIILMDINMPGIDGIGASQKITDLVPSVQIIIMSVQSDPNYLRRAMMAGARDFLTKPFGGDELVAAIRRVHDKRPTIVQATPSRSQRTGAAAAVADAPSLLEGHMIAVYSPKGGNGCTTIAINLGIALSKRGHKTILVDASLQFGDISVMLNQKAVTSIADLSERTDLDPDLLSSVVQVHRSGLHVLLAPPRPEMADMVTVENLKDLFAFLQQQYDFIIVDTPSYLHEKAIAVLDAAEKILLITHQSLPSLKNIRLFFDLADSLDYPDDKTWLVVNQVSSKNNISVEDVTRALKRPIIGTVPSEEIIVDAAANKGVPLLIGPNAKRPVSLAIVKIADHIIREMVGSGNRAQKDEKAEKQPGLLSRLFSRAGG